jgi:hypothetical protein
MTATELSDTSRGLGAVRVRALAVERSLVHVHASRTRARERTGQPVIANNLSKAGWSWGCVLSRGFQRANDLDCRRTSRRRWKGGQPVCFVK